MLKKRLTEREITDGTAMLLGGFDGLHLGHRQLLSRAKASGLPVVATTIVGGKEQPIFTLAEREDIFRRAGIDYTVEFPFAEIKDKTPEEFLRILEEEFSPRLYVCGEDFRFGAGAQGTPQWLEEGGQVCVEILSLLQFKGEKVSSRTVKKLLGAGDIPQANTLLGERFFLVGEVVRDRQIGRTIGFPTANIFYPQGKYPLKSGVYETRVCVDGKTYKGITNFGARPTFDDSKVVTETYLDGFEGNLYGGALKVEFVRYLRDIAKFDGVDGLKVQLEKDIERVRRND